MKNTLKNTAVIVVFLLTNFGLFSQKNDIPGEYSHSIGFTNILSQYHNNKGTVLKYYPALTYNIRVDCQINHEASFSATIYPTIGYAAPGNSNTQAGTSSAIPFCYELPVFLQLNFGQHSTGDSHYKNGRFFGIGACYGSYPNATSAGRGGHTVQSINAGKYTSLCLEAGIKFIYRKQSYAIRLQYSKPMGLKAGESANIFGLGVFYNFAQHYKF